MPAFAPILAHAFGKRYDLPVPLWLFVFGGAAVVFASFLVVWPTAVQPVAAGGPQLRDRMPIRPAAPLRMGVAWLLFLALAVVGWIGSQEVAENILPTASLWLLAQPVVEEAAPSGSPSKAAAAHAPHASTELISATERGGDASGAP